MSTTSRPRTSARSKLYERYDVEIQTTPESSSRKWLNEDEPPKEIPLEERTNLELMIMIYKTLSWRTKITTILVILTVISVSIRIAKRPKVQPTTIEEKRWMPADSHARCNPFAEDTSCAMEGVLEIKRIGGGRQIDEEQRMQELLRQEHVPIDMNRQQQHLDDEPQPKLQEQQTDIEITAKDTPIKNHEQLQQQQPGEDLIIYDDMV